MTHWADNTQILVNIRGYIIPLRPVVRRFVSDRAQNQGKAWLQNPRAYAASLLLSLLETSQHHYLP